MMSLLYLKDLDREKEGWREEGRERERENVIQKSYNNRAIIIESSILLKWAKQCMSTAVWYI